MLPIPAHNKDAKQIQRTFVLWRLPRNYLFTILIFSTPALIILQPFFGPYFGSFILILRVIVAPMLVILFRSRVIDGYSLVALCTLMLVTSYPGLSNHPTAFFLDSTTVLGWIVFYRFGESFANTSGNVTIWYWLVHGVTLVNLITLSLLGAVVYEFIDIQIIFEIIDRDVQFGITRFSLGNPIIVPYVLSGMIYAGMRCAPEGAVFVMSALVNLIVTAISQSRMVMLIAVLIFVQQWLRSSPNKRVFSLAILVIVLTVSWEFTGDLSISVIDRYQGQDHGSTNDRIKLVETILDSIDVKGLLIGQGLTASAHLNEHSTGIFRTAESTLLQMLYELGVAGLILLMGSVMLGTGRKFCCFWEPDPVVWLLWVELLFLLPPTSLLTMMGLAQGLLSGRHRLRQGHTPVPLPSS